MLVNISDNQPGVSQFKIVNALLSLSDTPVPHNCLCLPLPALMILYLLTSLEEVYFAQTSF